MINSLKTALTFIFVTFCTVGMLVYATDMKLPILVLMALMLCHLAYDSFMNRIILSKITEQLEETTKELAAIKTKVENSCWY